MLGRQRARWQRGALETFFKHRDMLFNPRYGRIGFVGFGQVLLVDVLGPLIEVLGYVLVPLMWAVGLLALDYLLAFLAITFTFGIFVSVATLILEEVELRRFPRARDLAVLTARRGARELRLSPAQQFLAIARFLAVPDARSRAGAR